MNDAAAKQVAQAVMTDLFERRWISGAVVVAPQADLEALKTAVPKRWEEQLAALSSGIAHAEPGDATVAAREARLKELRKVSFSFFQSEEPGAMPPEADIVFAVVPLSRSWLAGCGKLPVVDVQKALTSKA